MHELQQQLQELYWLIYASLIFLFGLAFVIWWLDKRFKKYEEHYNQFVLFAADQYEELTAKYEKLQQTFVAIQNNIASQTLTDVEDWNNLNIKLDYLLDKEKRAEDRAKAVATIFEKLDGLLKETEPKKTRKRQ